MIQMQVSITGIGKTQDKLKRLGSSLYDFKGAMSDIGEEAAKYYSTQAFASQGGVFGKRWPALSPQYARVKQKLYPGRGILIRTGKMQDNFTFVAGKDQVLIGNKSEHFKYHQSTLPRTKIPRRATMGVNDPVRQIVQTILEADVKKKLRSA